MSDEQQTKRLPRWANAQVTKAGQQKFKGMGLLMYVRRQSFEPDSKVIVTNGRHFITWLTQEDARQYLVLGKICENQERVEDNYQYYLHY